MTVQLGSDKKGCTQAISGKTSRTRTSRNQRFEAGTYHLTTNMSLDDALDVLDRGPAAPPSIRLTIPEGYRLTQIASRVEADLHVSAGDFLALAQSGRLSLAPYLPPGE